MSFIFGTVPLATLPRATRQCTWVVVAWPRECSWDVWQPCPNLGRGGVRGDVVVNLGGG